ncbi:MAG: peptidoglycan DD-metalloendopeptidase family protein [Gammaproteobacteria bacterium]|nr:peptidoglycan DD-metalloendopeptidase family protein [Gammaproteobacteria bacterium]MCP5139804.1 peptidoglycan DD-metalloendopeptidase family protein [Chromatiales bacterium]
MSRLLHCVGLSLLLLVAQPVAAARDPGKTEDELARVREQIRSLETQTRRDQAKRKDLDKQLRAAEDEASRLRGQLAATRRELAVVSKKLAELNRQMEQTRAELDRQRENLAAQLRLAHISEGNEMLRVTLNQQDARALGRHLTWLGYLARQRGELLASVQASLEMLNRDRVEVEQQQAALASLEGKRRQQLAELEKARSTRAAVISDLDQQLRSSNQQLRRARSEARTLENLLREIERQIARNQKGPAVVPGKPLGKGRWPVKGSLLADFGQSRAGGQMRWDGVLISAPAGSDVIAVRNGRVVYADWLPGLGQLLVIDHGGGYLSLYGHNQDLVHQVGEQVAAGEVIAHVGDTGGQPRPALYFEVRRNGQPLNPHQWVK